jgi:hypothetical protein
VRAQLRIVNSEYFNMKEDILGGIQYKI